MNDPSVQAMSRQSRDSNLTIALISTGFYELPETTIRANGKIHHIFKAIKPRDVHNLYQDKPSMDRTFIEFRSLPSSFWVEKYQPLTIDMIKDKNTDRYCLGQNSLFIPDTSLL